MGTRICKIVEEMAEIIEPKVGNPKNSVSRNWAILSYPWNLIFLMMRFSNFFLNYMVWKYQNEIAPIFYYGISTKTNEKDIKIPKLQPPDWKSPYWMSLYIMQTWEHYSFLACLLSPCLLSQSAPVSALQQCGRGADFLSATSWHFYWITVHYKHRGGSKYIIL